MSMPDTYKRRTLAVQLDQRKPEEREIFQYGDKLKKQQKWSATFRKAMRLIKDLNEGNLDVLFELFPKVQDTLAAQVLADVEVEMRSLRELMMAQERVHEPLALHAGATAALQPATSLFDDDTEDRESTEQEPEKLPAKKKTTSGSAFLSGLMKLDSDEAAHG